VILAHVLSLAAADTRCLAVNDLIISPDPQRKGEPNLPTEYVTVMHPRRAGPARIGFAIVFAAIALAVVSSVLTPASHSPAPSQQSEAAKPQDAAPASSNDVAGREVYALQTEIRALRAKLDELEKRQQAQEAATRSDPTMPANETKTVQEQRKIGRPAEPSPQSAVTKPAVTSVERSPKTLVGYKIRDVYNDSALIETGRGLISVSVGDLLPGAGQVTAIQKRAGHWIVMTESGEISGDGRRQARAEPPRRRFAPAPYYPQSLFYLPF
jgi:hypothetical protein